MITAAPQWLNAPKYLLSEKKIGSKIPQPDEVARLAALYQCKILDTPPEKEFDEIAENAALICGTPIALIGLIDCNRQWFKSKVGWDKISIERDFAFCAHTIRQKDILIVPNTLTDQRFATNPLVISQPYIQFYCGVPLITSDNQAVGTLCVIDFVPRELNCQQVEALHTLARQAVKLLELRRQATEVKSTHEQQTGRNRHFLTRMTTCLGLASAILVGVSLAEYHLTDSVHNDEKQQHYQVQENLKDIHSLIQKATIAENRYLTTRQASYLEHSDNITKKIKSKFAFLQQQTINNSDQQCRLATLKPLIERKFIALQTTQKNTISVQHLQVLQKQKAKLTNQISVTLREMEKTEDALSLRSQAKITKINKTIWTFSALFCLNLLIVVGLYYFSERSRDRKHGKTALEQLDLTDAILDRVGALVVVLDRQGRIFRFNRAAEQITGYSLATVKGKYFWELFSTPQDAQTAKNNWLKLLENQDSNQYENYLPSFDGSSHRIAWSNTTLRSRTGEIEYAIAFGIDITEHSSAESALRSSEQHLRNVINSLFTFVAVLTRDGTLIEANSALLAAAALQPEDVLGLPLTQTYWWSYSTAVQAQMQSAIECVISQGKPIRYEVEGRIGENQYMMIDFALTPMYDLAGKISYLIASGIDVTERKQAEAERQQANEQLSGWVNELKQRNREITLLSEISDFLQACLTVEEACTTLAQLVQPLFPGVSGGIFLINPTKNLVEPVASWGLPIVADLKSFTPTDCWGLRRGKPHWVDDTDNGLLCKHLHHVLPAESLCVPMMAQGEALGVLYLSSLETGSLTAAKQQLATTVAEHIALALANLKLRETLQTQSVRDVLSGLYNRRYMEEALTKEMEKCDRKQQPLSLIMLDVDHFKSINDTFGHSAGDVVLRELGKLLQRYVRAGDIACRYGGEEFILILPEASLNVTQQRAEQIQAAVKQLNVECSGHSLSTITVSIGVACFPEHGQSGEALLKAADTALYQAKQQGRDRAIVA